MLHRSPSWPQHCGRLWASCFAESLSLGFLMLHDSFQAIPFKKNFTLSNAMFSNVSYQVTQSFESSRNHGGCSVTQSCLTLCNPMGWLQRTRLPCPSLCPTFCSASWPLGLWCYLTISSSAALFSSCLQSFPASGPFPMSQPSTSGGRSIGASTSVLPMNIQGWFPLRSMMSVWELDHKESWVPKNWCF